MCLLLNSSTAQRSYQVFDTTLTNIDKGRYRCDGGDYSSLPEGEALPCLAEDSVRAAWVLEIEMLCVLLCRLLAYGRVDGCEDSECAALQEIPNGRDELTLQSVERRSIV